MTTRWPRKQFTRKAGDIIVFHPANPKYQTPAESDPNDLFAVASGMLHVVVNGVPVLVYEKLRGKKPGKVLV